MLLQDGIIEEPIKNLPLFEGINDSEISRIMKCVRASVHTYKKGEFISLESENIDNIGIVISGSVYMIKDDLWGNQSLLAYMNDGELFGETFACSRDSNESYVSFVAAKDTKVLFMPLERTLHTCTNSCECHHRMISNLFDLICSKNKRLMEKIEVTSKPTIREKLLSYLSLQAQHQKSRYIHISLNRQALASYLCINRSAMTRELTALKKEGVIDFDRNTFVIL